MNKRHFYIILLSLFFISVTLLFLVLSRRNTDTSSYLSSSDVSTSDIPFSVTTIPYNDSAIISDDACNSPIITSNCEFDLTVFPDKYNTGLIDSTCLLPFTPGSYGNINFYESGENDIKIDFWSTPSLSGTYYINNVDFSTKNVKVSNANRLQNDITIIFTNCKFKSFNSGETTDKPKYILNNCSFVSCYGSNMELNKCYIAGGVSDGIVPYQNVLVNNCYICDKSLQNTTEGKGSHTDGTQIYGSKKNGLSYDIHYYNCRFELPQLKNSSSTLNSCIMLQMEFADAKDISFEHCYLNGGGYSIYARACYDYKLSNIIFSNIYLGCAARWGAYCPCDGVKVRDDGVSFENLTQISHLLVGSVWNNQSTVFISVSNDTNKDRTLLVKTDEGNKYFSIPACYTYDQLTEDNTFSDYPFDMLLTIETTGSQIQCYDITNEPDILIRTYVME